MYKKLISALLIAAMMIFELFPVQTVHAEENVNSAPLETGGTSCCGTDPVLLQELNTALLQKRGFDLERKAMGYSIDWEIPTNFGTLTPSTGEVKFLVLPIAYPDYPEMKAAYNEQKLYDKYFAEYDPSLEMRDQSLRGYYYKTSCGKLSFTGGVLPVYTAPKESTYYAKASASENPQNDLIKDALAYYVSQGYDLSDYDGNGDGEVDAFSVKYLLPKNDRGEDWYYWNAKIWAQNYTELDGIKVTRYLFSGIQDHVSTDEHETGHLMGLIDNYKATGACVIDNGLEDMMSCTGYYFCAYHKYLLGWIDPVVLTNENDIAEMDPLDLYAVESCDETSGDKPQAVILIPEPDMLPFTEYFILEYRNGSFPTMYSDPVFKGNPGVAIWHCRTFLRPPKYLSYEDQTDYIETVKRVGATEIYEIEDAYRKGDIFSSDSEGANSNFANGDYTGAYMEVLETTSEKATLKVGFREPDLSPPPVIEISEASPKAVKMNSIGSRFDSVVFTVSALSNEELIPGDNLTLPFYLEVNQSDGAEKANIGSWKGNPAKIEVSPKSEGILSFTVKAGAATYRGKRSREVTSKTFYADCTPPEVTLNDGSAITLERGEAYIEPGATVTDNLDPDIIAGKLDGKLVIDSSQVDTDTIGTYTVTYTATDHAGNETTEKRNIVVQDTIAPTASVEYSTTQPTNGDVTATITFSEPVTISSGADKLAPTSDPLVYTALFTENGTLSIGFADAGGNTGTVEAAVSNIDKSLPTGTISYDITSPTNQAVTATLTVGAGVTITNNSGKNTHLFTENGSFVFEIQNAAGTKGTVAATVNWIDKTPPTATVEYSPSTATNGNVTATLKPSEAVTVTNNGGSSTYTFSGNGSFTFEFKDAAGNTGNAIATVDWIDKTPPTATVEYSPSIATNGNVTATLKPSEAVTVTNNGGNYTYTFSDNGSFTFEFKDAAGNTGNATATVDWIDKTSPTATVEYSITDWTNKDVTATIVPSERVTVVSSGGESHTFTANGFFTFEFEDKAGNQGSVTATVRNIDKTPPVISLKGDNPQTIEQGKSYTELGASVTDDLDTGIDKKLRTDASQVDTSKAGEYVVVYTATDHAGNIAEAKREVVVKAKTSDPTPPAPGPVPDLDPTPTPTPSWENPFIDVAEHDWYYSAVRYASENGLFYGTSNTTFSPNDDMTRGMLATVIYRLAKEPETAAEDLFNDVADGKYYTEAIAWAAENGIVAGYGNNRFGPEDPITREQLATILWRYAGSPESFGSLDKFSDGKKASSYAVPALKWVVEQKIVSGKGNGILDPGGNATRAEVAAMLMRYCKISKK